MSQHTPVSDKIIKRNQIEVLSMAEELPAVKCVVCFVEVGGFRKH